MDSNVITKPDDKWLAELRKEYNEDELSRRRRLNDAFWRRPKDTRPLLVRANEAVSWGIPDNESTGFTHAELVRIISELLAENERLRNGH